jgi:hypothetical protein
MATPSDALPLGSTLPAVRLTNALDGAAVDVGALAAGKKGALVMFVCNHCPYVVHILGELVRVANEAVERGFAVVAINSNDAETYPQDAPQAMARLAREGGWRFPFLFDASQDVARALGAACTPEFFLFDARSALVYHGQFDDSRPSNGKPITGHDLRAALADVEAGRAPSADQKTAVGCSIKWRR